MMHGVACSAGTRRAGMGDPSWFEVFCGVDYFIFLGNILQYPCFVGGQ